MLVTIFPSTLTCCPEEDLTTTEVYDTCQSLCYNRPSEDRQGTNTNLQHVDFSTMGGRLRITEVKTKNSFLQIDVNPGGGGNVCQCVAGECGSNNLKRFNR